MKKILFPIIALILIACSPQVTPPLPLLGEGTGVRETPPPTQTPIPTPTLHPDFVALQNLINDSGERFSLLPDGTIEEQTADGGRQTIPNLNVDQNGVINIIFNNERVVIETSQISFDDEGLTIDGYELNENGEWVEAVSEAMQMATGLAEQYGVDPKSVTIAEVDGAVNVTDQETGKVLIRTNGVQIWYGIEFATDTIAAASCEPTDFKPSRRGYMLAEYDPASQKYWEIFLKDINYKFNVPEGTRIEIYDILIDRENQCWGEVFSHKQELLFRDVDGVPQRLPLIALKAAELVAFQTSR